MKYDYYKENYLKKESNKKLNYIEDILGRNREEIKSRAAIKFYKQLPDDVKSNYISFEEYFREFKELNESLEDKFHKKIEFITRTGGKFPTKSLEITDPSRKNFIFKRHRRESHFNLLVYILEIINKWSQNRKKC